MQSTLLDSLSLWRMAVWVPLLAVVPEFAQHLAEIRLGMFRSIESFRELANSPRRMRWGYPKVAGLLMAAIAALWVLARTTGGPLDGQQVMLAIVLNLALFVAGWWGKRHKDANFAIKWVMHALTIATLPVLTFTVGAVLGDKAMTLGQSFIDGWWPALRMLLILLSGFVPMQIVHKCNHRLAMGRGQTLVLPIMLLDAFLVGLMACWMGAALYNGYR